MKPQWMSMADPIHGVIRLNRKRHSHHLVLEVMNSKAFQRLRRIKQMGMAEFVFPGATHSRFVHSIGAMWLMTKAIEHFQEDPEIRSLLNSPFESYGIPIETILLVSILVHDIGHTPLSHTLEDILDLKEKALLHDNYWNRLILEHDPDLQVLWQKTYPNMPEAIAKFNGWGQDEKAHFLADLVSSQLDMDRLDYLQRDSHYLGVQYGRIELERIITNLCVGTTPQGKTAIAVREEATPAVEHYLFGRYEAYKMALHALDKAAECLLKKTLLRFYWARQNNVDTGHPAELLFQLMDDGKNLSVEDYFMLDDCYLWDKMNLWARYSQDPQLKALADRLLSHDLLKFVEIAPILDPERQAAFETVLEGMKNHYEKRGLSFEFGFDWGHVTPKPLYQSGVDRTPIWIRTHEHKLIDFKEASSLPLNTDTPLKSRCLIFTWDKEAQHTLRGLLQTAKL